MKLKRMMQQRPPHLTRHERACVRSGRMPMVTLLLGHGARLDVADRSGCTPLHLAVEAGAKDLAVLLIAKGADAEVRPAEMALFPCLLVTMVHQMI